MKNNLNTSQFSGSTVALFVLFALVLAVIFISIFATGDDVDSGSATTTDSAATTSQPGVQDATERQEGDVVSTSSADTYYEMSAQLPAIDSQRPGAAAVRSEIEQNIAEFIAQANEQGPEVADFRGQVLQYQKDIALEVFTSGTYTSYYIEDYSFTGGASGNATVETFIYDETGREVSGEVIPADRQTTFLTAVGDDLRGRDFAQGGTFSSIINELTFADLSYYLNENEEIVVVFSAYAVAPGAAGIVTVTLPQAPYLAQ